MSGCMKIHPTDTVAIALRDIGQGETVTVDEVDISAVDSIPRGNKIAVTRIAEGETVTKYGFSIGRATQDIETGMLVHTHNMKTNLDKISSYEYTPNITPLPYQDEQRTFSGYMRANGEAGIRNELWIVPTVGCVNGTAEKIRDEFLKAVAPEGIDAVVVHSHPYGCSQLGEDHAATRTVLGDLVKHPNAGGVLVLGLGCENNQVAEFRESLGEYDTERTRFLIAQDVADEIAEGVALLKELYETACKDRRTDIPLSALKIGLKCGGSDGFSGITANPLLGLLSDYLVAQGATTILTEVPEMFGAETVLMEHASDKDVFEKIVRLINDFKDYFSSHDQPIYENPSPGNKAGGITTLEEKSLGCTQKGGTASVVDVLDYGERLTKSGLNLLSAPGNDLVASTALAASGCHMVLFSTGRGTPFGTFVPTAKISTNTELALKKPHWIDFDAGTMLDAENRDTILRSLADFVIAVAEGMPVNNEKHGFRGISIFKTGVTL